MSLRRVFTQSQIALELHEGPRTPPNRTDARRPAYPFISISVLTAAASFTRPVPAFLSPPSPSFQVVLALLPTQIPPHIPTSSHSTPMLLLPFLPILLPLFPSALFARAHASPPLLGARHTPSGGASASSTAALRAGPTPSPSTSARPRRTFPPAATPRSRRTRAASTGRSPARAPARPLGAARSWGGHGTQANGFVLVGAKESGRRSWLPFSFVRFGRALCA